MNLNEPSDDELDQLRIEVLTSAERRQSRDQIPAQIADLTQRYIEAGGDPDELSPLPEDQYEEIVQETP